MDNNGTAQNRTRNLRVLVIGGSNADICGSPSAEFRLHDSNPGRITIRAGGVGRNIAHNLRLLGAEVSMITAFGGDGFFPFLRDNLAGLGIDCSRSVFAKGVPTSSYLYILDDAGEMSSAISDMDAVSLITPEHVEKNLEYINSFPAVVIDANLSAETIACICSRCTIPIYADPVSVTKAEKMRSVLPALRMIKPNALEAELLTGEANPAAAAEALFRLGVGTPFVSAGTDGIFAFDGTEAVSVPAVPVKAVNVTGAGDAATAALVFAGLSGLTVRESALLAAGAGAKAVSCGDTVCPNIEEILRPQPENLC